MKIHISSISVSHVLMQWFFMLNAEFDLKTTRTLVVLSAQTLQTPSNGLNAIEKLSLDARKDDLLSTRCSILNSGMPI